MSSFNSYLKNGLQLFWSLAYALKRGRTVGKIKQVRKIIVAQTAKLGDMVCTTPVLRAIKKNMPEAHLSVVGLKNNRFVLDHSALIDEFIDYDGSIPKLTDIARRFDVGILVTPNFKILSAFYLSGMPMIVAPRVKNGFSPYETMAYKALSFLVTTRPHYMGRYAPREYLRLLEPLGIFTDSTVKSLGFSSNAGYKIKDLLTKAGFVPAEDLLVGVAVSTNNKIKQWPLEKFVEVISYLHEEYNAKVILTGSQNDETAIKHVLSCLRGNGWFLGSWQLNLDELKALISKLSLFISVDSGPIYIAEAFNIPTIDIVGPMDEAEQPPRGGLNEVVILPDRKGPELHIMNARHYNYEEARRQIEEITPAMVNEKIDQICSKLNFK